MSQKSTYVFIYGVSKSRGTGLSGLIKKLAGGQERCALGELTGGSGDAKPAWREFRDSLGEKAAFHYSDEIPPEIRAYIDKAGVALPVVLEWSGFGYRILVSKDELVGCGGDDRKLVEMIRKRKEQQP